MKCCGKITHADQLGDHEVLEDIRDDVNAIVREANKKAENELRNWDDTEEEKKFKDLWVPRRRDASHWVIQSKYTIIQEDVNDLLKSIATRGLTCHINGGTHGSPDGLNAYTGAGLADSDFTQDDFDSAKDICVACSFHNVTSQVGPTYPEHANIVINSWCFSDFHKRIEPGAGAPELERPEWLRVDSGNWGDYWYQGDYQKNGNRWVMDAGYGVVNFFAGGMTHSYYLKAASDRWEIHPTSRTGLAGQSVHAASSSKCNPEETGPWACTWNHGLKVVKLK